MPAPVKDRGAASGAGGDRATLGVEHDRARCEAVNFGVGATRCSAASRRVRHRGEDGYAQSRLAEMRRSVNVTASTRR